jgi:hypothetical protein
VSLQDEYNQNPNGQGFVPPNPMGAAGPSQFVEFIHGRFAVYSKTGTLITSEPLDTFWSPAQPLGAAVDPRIVYDAHSGHWLASSRDTNNNRPGNNLLLAVSQTSDATGTWTEYKIMAGTGRAFIDYDTLGVDDNGVYFGMTVHDVPTNLDSAAIFAIPKGPLLSQGVVTATKFYGIRDMLPAPQPAFNFDTVGPSDLEWFVGSTSSLANIAYRTLTWNAGTPALSATSTVLSTPAFGPVVSVPSLGGTQNIATVDDRLQMAVIRNHQLWTARHVGVNSSGGATANPDRDAAEFLELDVSTSVASLIQSGRAFDPSTTNPRSYIFPSVTVNGVGYMVMAFSGASATEYAGDYATGRLPSDPLGALQPVTQIKAGEGAYTILMGNLLNRWGDYSYTSVDPTDDRTIWTIQEYAAQTVPPGSPAGDNTSRWGTWIQSFASPKLASTVALTSSPNPSLFEQAVTFTAVVSSPGSLVTPTGTVDFTEGIADLTPGGIALSGGVATFATKLLPVGNHTITATYSGDSDFFSSTVDDSAHPQEVRGSTLTLLKSSPNPSVFGQAVTFTATVSAGAAGTPTGTVDFTEGSTDFTPEGIALSGGVATFSTSALALGSHTITASYSGDANFHASAGDDSAGPQKVKQAATATVVKSTATQTVYGQTVSFTATVRVSSPGSGLPTGLVTFKDGTATLGTGTLNNSHQATFNTAALSAGSHAITATYGGDTNFNGSTSGAYGQSVTRDATITTVSSSKSPSVFGQFITLSATVTASAPGGGVPTGTVTFQEGTTVLAANLVLKSPGLAMLVTKALAVGTHTITAVYGGDANFQSSSGNDSGSAQIVKQDGTQTSVVADVNPAVVGQPVTFTASVQPNAPGSGTATGTVTFKDFGVLLGTATLSAGLATIAGPSLARGNHSIVASYSGDASFVASTSIAYGETISTGATTTALQCSLNPSTFGNAVTFTAAVHVTAPASGAPTGTVTFQEGTSVLAVKTLGSTPQATFSTSALAGGAHTITAVYGGDTNFTSSTSGAVNQSVSKAGTKSTLSAAASQAVFGQVVTFTAVVSRSVSGAGIPSGTVSFNDGTKMLGSATLDGTGQAIFRSSSLGVGSHTITAVYAGSSNFVGSSSPAITETVARDSTTTTLQSSQNPSVVGQAVTFTATVRASAPGAGIASGTVSFLDFGATLGPGTLNAAGQATFGTSSLSAGNHAITTVYGGDSHFTGSTAAPFGQTVHSSTTASQSPALLSSNPSPHASTAPASNAGTLPATPPLDRGLSPSMIDSFFASKPHRSAAQPLMVHRLPLTEGAWLGPAFPSA